MIVSFKHSRKAIVSICLSIILPLSLISFQSFEDPIEKIITGFDRYLSDLPQEKIYVHFDRSHYVSGEKIWFKTYLTIGPNHEPSSFSRTIYIELFDKQLKIIQRQKLFSSNGSAAGFIQLSDSLTSGNYLFRAYTNWMRNEEDNYFFNRTIKIFHPEKIDSESIDDRVDIQFFPEGGELVTNIQSKVGFKAIGIDGLGRLVKGKIMEGQNIVCEFKSNALGMGAFHLKPKSGLRYKAIIDSTESEYNLPPAKEKGLVLSISNQPNSKDIILKVQIDDSKSIKSIFIIGQTRGMVCFSAKADLSTNIAITKIPKLKFPTGIAQFTILSDDMTPVAERLIFIDQHDNLIIGIKSKKKIYNPRELITLDITALHKNGKPALANLSLSVFDEQQVLTDDNRETISSYLLVSSELHGFIESPGYYFNNQNADRFEAMDFLLLTQGWRRLTIKQVLTENWHEPIHRAEQGLTIKGKLVDINNEKPIANGKISYLIMNPFPETKTTTSNSSGDFEIANIIYFDSTDAMLQGETKKGLKTVKVLTTDIELPKINYPIFPLIGSQSDFEKNFISKSVIRKRIDMTYNFDTTLVTLETIEINGKREEFIKSVHRSFGNGTVSQNVSGLIANQMHPLQLIQGKVAGVQVSGSGDNWDVKIQGIGSIKSGTTPLFMVDDIPVLLESLSSIPAQNIESFTVWKGADAAIFGARGANGAIGFYTKKIIHERARESSSITQLKRGYESEREFYSPRYDVSLPEHIKPDRRVTLFWAPHVYTDSTGHAQITFYNHDIETTITGILEGMSYSGEMGSYTFKYEINK